MDRFVPRDGNFCNENSNHGWKPLDWSSAGRHKFKGLIAPCTQLGHFFAKDVYRQRSCQEITRLKLMFSLDLTEIIHAPKEEIGLSEWQTQKEKAEKDDSE